MMTIINDYQPPSSAGDLNQLRFCVNEHYFDLIYAEKFQKADGIETLFQNKILSVHRNKHPRKCQLSMIRL